MNTHNEVFSELDILKRPSKPRERSLTVQIDRGISLEYLDEHLKIYLDYIYLAKIITGTLVLLSKDDLKSALPNVYWAKPGLMSLKNRYCVIRSALCTMV